MHRSYFPLLVALMIAAPASAIDLSKIDRTIKKEPAYTGKPSYLLLAFGERAERRVWLVRDGDVLYVDRDGDGDLTGQDEKVAKKAERSRSADDVTFEVGELRVGGKVHKALTVKCGPLKRLADEPSLADYRPLQDAVKADPRAWGAILSLDVHHARLKGGGLAGRVGVSAGPYDGQGMLLFAASPKGAPVIHPEGPLEVTLSSSPSLALGRPNDLVLVVGAKGRGPGTLATLAYEECIPEAAHPKVEVAWPAAKAGERPIREIYELKERC